MMSDVTADHAQRLTTIAQALNLVRERLEFLETKTVVIEPKVNTIETELVRAARDIAANDTAMKVIVEANDAHVKATLEKNDQEIKKQLETMKVVMEGLAAGTQAPRQGGRVETEAVDGAARRGLAEANDRIKSMDSDVREALRVMRKDIEDFSSHAITAVSQIAERVTVVENRPAQQGAPASTAAGSPTPTFDPWMGAKLPGSYTEPRPADVPR